MEGPKKKKKMMYTKASKNKLGDASPVNRTRGLPKLLYRLYLATADFTTKPAMQFLIEPTGVFALIIEITNAYVAT